MSTRKVIIEGIKGTNYRKDLGPDTFLIEAISKLPENANVSEITYSVYMSGKDLKAFLKEKAPYYEDVIKELIDNGNYELIAWDW